MRRDNGRTLINTPMFVLGNHDPISTADGQWQGPLINVKALAEAGFWVAWGLPTQGRKNKPSTAQRDNGLSRVARPGPADGALGHCRSQAADHGTGRLHPDSDSLRHDALVGDGITEATDLFEQSAPKGRSQHDHNRGDGCCSWDVCPFCCKHTRVWYKNDLSKRSRQTRQHRQRDVRAIRQGTQHVRGALRRPVRQHHAAAHRPHEGVGRCARRSRRC
jgi:hypothetical protein